MEKLMQDHHGGRCCGIRHLYGFDRETMEGLPNYKEIKRDIAFWILNLTTTTVEDPEWGEVETIDGEEVACEGQLTIEMCLTDTQLRLTPRGGKETIQEIIEGFGFKKVARWQNPNTSNYVNMYLHGNLEDI